MKKKLTNKEILSHAWKSEGLDKIENYDEYGERDDSIRYVALIYGSLIQGTPYSEVLLSSIHSSRTINVKIKCEWYYLGPEWNYTYKCFNISPNSKITIGASGWHNPSLGFDTVYRFSIVESCFR